MYVCRPAGRSRLREISVFGVNEVEVNGKSWRVYWGFTNDLGTFFSNNRFSL